MCAVTSHKECSTVVPLDELARRSKKSGLFADFSKIASYVQSLIDTQKEYLSDLDNEETFILSEAFKAKDNAIQKVETLYADFEVLVKKKYSETRQAQEKRLDTLCDVHCNVEKCSKKVEILQHVPDTKSVVMMENLRGEANKEYKKITEILKKEPNVSFKFEPDATVTLLTDTLSNFGDLKKEIRPVTSSREAGAIEDFIKSLDVRLLIPATAQTLVPTTSSKQGILTSKVNLVKVVTHADLNIHGAVHFSDGVFIDDNNCLFTDNNNSRLVMIGEDLKVKKEIQIKGYPAGIALSQDKAGVYVVCSKDVLLYSLQGNNRLIRTLHLETPVYGLGISGNTIITGREGRVIQRDIDGNQANALPAQGWVYSIAVSNDGTRFYHRDGNRICCRDVRTCNMMWTYNNKVLPDPDDICVDYNDNIYTVGYRSKNVHQISKSGSSQRVLVDKLKQIDHPSAIVFHPTRPMFIVTSANEATVMEVYEFS